MPLPSDISYGGKLPSVAHLTYLAGDYWYRLFPNPEQLDAINGAFREEVRQAVREMDELTLAATYDTATGLRTCTYWPIVVPVSQVRQAPVRYGEGYLYGSGDPVQNILYGQTLPYAWEIPAPAYFYDMAAVCDRIISPRQMHVEGVEAFVRVEAGQRWLQLPGDPANYTQTIPGSPDVTAIVVWCYMARFDFRDAATTYGELMGLPLPYADSYMDVIRAVFGAYINGGNEIYLRQLLAAVVGQKTPDDDGQTVLTVLTDKLTPVVITDRETFLGKPGDTPTVTIGQTLTAGDLLFDSVRLTDGGRESASWLTELLIPRRFTGLRFDLLVTAGTHPITGTGDDILVEFSDEPEVNTAFAEWLNRGRGLEYELQRYFEASGNVWDANNPPAAVDLLDMLRERWLSVSVSVSRLRKAAVEPYGRAYLAMIREVLPPWVSHLVQIDDDWSEPNVCLIPPELLATREVLLPPTTTTTTSPPTSTTTGCDIEGCLSGFYAVSSDHVLYACADGAWTKYFEHGNFCPPEADHDPLVGACDPCDCQAVLCTTTTTTTTTAPPTTTTTTTTLPPTTTTTTTTLPPTTTTTTPTPTSTTTSTGACSASTCTYDYDGATWYVLANLCSPGCQCAAYSLPSPDPYDPEADYTVGVPCIPNPT